MVLLATAVLMTVYQFIKMWFFPKITLWQSHAMTIAVSSTLAALGAFYVSRQNQRLHRRADEETSARQQAEAERERFFTLSLDLLCITGTDGFFKQVNPAFTQTLGYTSNEMQAKPILDFVHPEEHASTLVAMEKLNRGERTIHFENRYQRKDRSWRCISWKAQREAERGLTYATGRDITEQKEADAKIARLNANLKHQTEQLLEANKELESFSYSVSHDLRAPLRHVQGYVEMLQKNIDGQLSEKARRYLKIINEASTEMGQLIDDLLAFSRMGRIEMSEGSVELNTLLQEALHGLEPTTQNRNIEWKTAPLPVVTGDAAVLRQVLVNLVGNAVKYTRPRDPALIEIGTAGEEDGRLILFVRDNGVGFDMQYAHKLFGVFQRLHRADEFEGTGIGLANVRRIIARHGGRVWAESKPGEGSTFYFTLKRSTNS
ncbi:MAG: ATP-binding protein [Prosthecobacter sp.]|uniref:sensor histidine kinase n=1 Tax=Prosthecobacter sp. TaxID=1965333 RepID=UPI003BAE3DA5